MEQSETRHSDSCSCCLLVPFLGHHPQATHFNVAQLGHGISLDIHVREPVCKHEAGDLRALLLVSPSSIFVGHHVVEIGRDAEPVEPHPIFTDPAKGRIGICTGFHGGT